MKLILLSEENAKTKKRKDELGVLPFILNLAPGDLSGYETCPARGRCGDLCLNWSGHARFDTAQRARVNRTLDFFQDRPWFMGTLVRDLAEAERRGIAAERITAVRLNGTSDIVWERVPCTRNGVSYPNVMAAFPEVTFYDYTKLPGRRNLPPNYLLTFSLDEGNDRIALRQLATGRNVAVVFDTRDLPATWNGYPVIDGESHDFRFLDPQGGHIVALYPKGRAMGDSSGFVKSIDYDLDPSKVPAFAARVAAPVALAAD